MQSTIIKDETALGEVIKPPSCIERLIINENSRWKAVFDIVMLMMVGYSCFTSIY